jgi:F-type H+-transporting ATPase subunit b
MDFLYDTNTWVLVSFVGFIGLLIYFGIPARVAEALDQRAARIRDELEEARRIRDEAQKILADYQRKQRDAEKEAEGIVAQARSEAQAYAAEMRQSMKDTLDRRTALAEQKIARAEAQAVAEVRSAAVEKAVAAAQAIIVKDMTQARADQLVEASVADVRARLN